MLRPGISRGGQPAEVSARQKLLGATHLRPVALAGKYGENAWIARPVAWLDDHTPREREVGKLQLVDLGQRRNMLDDYLMLIEHGDPP